uniref:Apolipoprotein L domain containing 1 n=1 Tax=Sarcophilus harrisii TaxID=9305 RepID=A0A7N4PB53_SARHA
MNETRIRKNPEAQASPQDICVMERLIVPQPQAVDSLRRFQVLLLDRRSRLHGQIRSLRDIIRKIEKLRKRSLLAYITGSSLSAAGAITAIVGLSLSPITLGTSLLASAVGLGVATAGGAVTLSSDLSLVFRNSRDLRRVQDIAAICQDQMREILGCLDFFCRGQGCLDFQLLQSGKKASIALYNSVYFIVFFGSRGFLIPRHAEGATKVSQAILKAKIQKLAESLESCTAALDELSQQLESRVQLYAKTKHENPALDSKESLDKYGGMFF